jgi:hypothetical protein
MTGCSHLEEILSDELMFLKKQIVFNGNKVDNDNLMKYVKKYARDYRLNYCSVVCPYRADCDVNKGDDVNG